MDTDLRPGPGAAASVLVPEAALAVLADAQTDATATIALVEQLKARLDAVALVAWHVLHATYLAAIPESLSPSDRADLARSGTVAEVMAATGLPEGQCWRRLRLAVADPERTTTMLATLTGGAATLNRVLAVHERTAHLTPAQAERIAGRALAPARDGSPAAEALVTRRVHRLVAASQTPEQAQDAHDRAVSRRGLHTSVYPDGSGELLVTGDAARVVAAATRVDTLARKARSCGVHDGRTLAQLRSDITLDLLLHGHTLPTPAPGAVADPSADGAVGPPGESPGQGAFGVDWAGLGQLPPAQVQVIVPLSSLLGLDETPGEIPGHGPLTAEHTRAVAHRLGSVWQRLVVDPVNGELLELSGTRYAAPPRLRAHVSTRDHTCRAPGCEHPADQADLDHVRPWPTGPTAAHNLTATHRGHHNLKTNRLWRNDIDPVTGALHWTTLTGRRYTTYPHDHLDTHHAVGSTHPCLPPPGPVQIPGSPSGGSAGCPDTARSPDPDEGSPPIEHRRLRRPGPPPRTADPESPTSDSESRPAPDRLPRDTGPPPF